VHDSGEGVYWHAWVVLQPMLGCQEDVQGAQREAQEGMMENRWKKGQFVSGFMKKLYWLLGIEGNSFTAYHPQTNGQTKRTNQELEQYLQIFVNH
jgi:hypothetical protein